MIVIDGHGWIFNVAYGRRPAFEAVVDSPRDGRAVGHLPPLFLKSEMQRIVLVVQLKVLTTCVCHAPDLDDAAAKAGL